MRTIYLSQIYICNSASYVPPNVWMTRCATASIKKPIHNVKEAGRSRMFGQIAPAKKVSSSLEKFERAAPAA
jgi:hypothetical protein